MHPGEHKEGLTEKVILLHPRGVTKEKKVPIAGTLQSTESDEFPNSVEKRIEQEH